MKQKKTIRLFFALWPDQEVREKIITSSRAISRQKKGPRVDDYNLHMTLIFIGNTGIDNLHCLDAQARKVTSPCFELTIDKIGYFKKPGIIWLGCNTIPRELVLLHANLADQLSKCDYKPEKRDYRPHVSLFRKSSLVATPVLKTPFCWQPDGFSLIESKQDRNGVKYTEIKKYPFTS